MCQHTRDQELIKNFERYWGCGKYYSRSDRDMGNFVVRKFSEITDILIPFFDKYPLQGNKRLDYADFKKAAEVMEGKFNSFRYRRDPKIKANMNRGRLS